MYVPAILGREEEVLEKQGMVQTDVYIHVCTICTYVYVYICITICIYVYYMWLYCLVPRTLRGPVCTLLQHPGQRKQNEKTKDTCLFFM